MMKIIAPFVLSFALAVQAKELDVRSFGAVPDGKTDCTTAIQKALNVCGGTGDTVKFAAGTYLSKPLVIRTKTTILLEAGATLLASPVQADYLKDGNDWLKATSSSEFMPFILGEDLTDVTITGQGVIDGNGAVWWGEAEKARQRIPGYTLPRPNLMAFNRTKNLHLSRIKLTNSPKFHLVPTDCENVMIDGIQIVSPEGAANTDGIDPGNCRNVTITRCLIDTGDDDIAIKSGRKIEGRAFGCENITVTDCTFLHGHGLSIGSESIGGIRGLTVKNCTFDGTENGLRLKSRRGKGGLVQDILYSDITMTNVRPAISFVCYYQDSSQAKFPTNDVAQPVTRTTPIFRNIRITNVTAHATGEAGKIVGLPESQVENVVLDNVHLFASTGMTIVNAKGVQFLNSAITVENGAPIDAFNAGVTSQPASNIP